MPESGSPPSSRTSVRSILSFLLSLVMLTGLLAAVPASALARNHRPDVQDDVSVEGREATEAAISKNDEVADAAVTDLGESEWPGPGKVETDLASPSSTQADTPVVPDRDETVAVAPVDKTTLDEWESPLPQDMSENGESTANESGESQNTPDPGPSSAVPSQTPEAGPSDTPPVEPSPEPEEAGTAPPPEDPAEEEPGNPEPAETEPVRSAEVEILGQAAAEQAGVTGVLLRVTRTDGTPTTGPVQVGFDYSEFASAFGADYASRLTLVALDDCVLDTSALECAPEITLDSTNDFQAMTLNAVAPAAAGAGTLLAVSAEASGGTGDYAASEISQSAAWNVNAQSGDFSWSYGLAAPPVPGGLSPQLGFGYSAQSVDGRTASSNNQTSWLGEGFSYAPGSIQRSYTACADDGRPAGTTGDLCWKTDNATLSMSGHAGELVEHDDGSYRLKNDDGTKVERLTGADNGDNDGEYWKVTTTDGTQYFFGRNRLPGWESSDPETDSAWTVPVYGNDPGEPCHESTFTGSWCQQARAWNLDYVVDVHGNAMTYHYTKERNHYGRNGETAATPYDRGGYLTHIDYGLRSDDLYATAPARVEFTVGERCLPTDSFDCAPSKLTEANASKWPDVPFDQHCAAGTQCTGRFSPTFWTRKKLDKVTTQVHDGTAYTDVDSWTLEHKYPAPGDGTTPSLWLNSVTHTGHVGGTVTMPKVTFAGTALENRVDGLSDGLAPMLKYRVTSVYTETGGQIDVSYSGEDCARGSTPKPHDNGKRCYPVRWTPEGDAELTDWFHKYVVTQIAEIDLVADQPDTITTYEYLGGGAWRYEEADGFTKDKYRTWSQWRGYERVKVISGAPGEQQSETEHLFFRGMHGDKQPSGTRSVTVTDSEGGTHTDHNELAGTVREEITRDGAGGEVIGKTITDPWRKETAEDVHPWATVRAYMLGVAETHTYTALGDGEWRRTRVENTMDDYGAVVQVNDLGDVDDPDDDECTRTTYTRNTGKWLLNLVSRSEAVSVNCGTTPSRPADVVTDERIHYDGLAFGATPAKGSPTTTEKIDSYDDGKPVYQRVALSAYDAYGRETSVTDPAGNATTTAYTHDSAGLLASSAQTTPATENSPDGHTTTSVLDPARGLPLSETDANGNRIDFAYDALGRLTSVWLPHRDKATETPTAKFEYHIRNDAPTSVVTHTIRNDGQYNTSYEIYDGLVRPRQTQAPAVGDEGRLVTDTFHDSRGLVVKERQPYYNDDAEPGDTLLVVDNDDEVPRQTETVYDGAGRATDVIHVSRGNEQWRTTTEHLGDRTETTFPEGQSAVTTVTDARGRTTELRNHHGSTPDTAFDATTYTYAKNGELATVTDAEGNVWETVYDLRGRKAESTHPDSGTTTYAYNQLDQLVSTTDARGETLAYTYDALGRKTGLYDDSPQGTRRAGWVYDTVAKGHLTSSTRYIDGAEYTTRVLDYDEMNRPLASRILIPSTEGALAGTYQFVTRYNTDGTPRTMTYPAAGGLPREVVAYSYNDLGMPTAVQGLAQNAYVAETLYSRTGDLLQREFDLDPELTDTTTDKTWATRVYDEATNRLASSGVVHQIGSGSLTAQTYEYDDAGNVLRVGDAPTGEGLADDTQCFDYDHLRRLTEVWTPDTHDAAACDAAPAADALGGAAPYWHSYTYDAVGNRETEIQHAAGGDTTRAYTTPAPGQDQPHTLTRVDQTGPGGTQLEQYDYDDAGNMTSRVTPARDQTLEWDAEGKLVRVTDGDAQTEFRYGADGSRLVRETPTDATLYLPGMEVRMDKVAFSLEATRFYEHAGESVAVRNSDGTVSWVFSDHQATGQLAVDALTGQTVRRRSTAFGVDRGSSGEWPSDRGFVDGTLDASVGLTQLGARAYDAAVGRFVSVDPVVDFADSQQMHGYAYANNSPVTFSDPSGLLLVASPGWSRPPVPQGANDIWRMKSRIQQYLGWQRYGTKSSYYKAWVGSSSSSYRGGGSYGSSSGSSPGYASGTPSEQEEAKQVLIEAAIGLGQIVADELGISAGIECLTTGDLGACGETALNVALSLFSPGGVVGKLVVKYGLRWRKGAALLARVEEFGGQIVSSIRTLMRKDPGDALPAGGSCPVGRPNSFVAGTRVLMADGTSKAIEEVKTGEEVLASDPDTGKSGAERVLATIIGSGAKHLVEITVDPTTEKPAGDDGDGDGVPGPVVVGDALIATDEHPFWVPEAGQWIDAGDLTPGTWLHTSAGTWVQVTAVRKWTQTTTAHNLTIADPHTYHAGAAAVLVHNCGDGKIDEISENIASHANGEAIRPDGEGTHFVRGVDERALGHYVDGVINGNVSGVRARYLNNGRVGYWDPDKQAVVIEDGDRGTVFTPKEGEWWFENKLS